MFKKRCFNWWNKIDGNIQNEMFYSSSSLHFSMLNKCIITREKKLSFICKFQIEIKGNNYLKS